MNKLDMIKAARERLLTHGWSQGSLLDAEDKTCLVGAFTTASGHTYSSSIELGEIFDVIVSIVGGPITKWNDVPGRTFNEIMDALDQLALRVKEEV